MSVQLNGIGHPWGPKSAETQSFQGLYPLDPCRGSAPGPHPHGLASLAKYLPHFNIQMLAALVTASITLMYMYILYIV